MRRKGKAFAVAAVGLGLAVLVGVGIASKDRILEKWWLHKLKTGGEREKETAARALARVKSIGAVPVLATLLCSEASARALLLEGNGKHRYLKVHYAASALEKIGVPAVPALGDCLEHRNPLVRVQAALALCRIGPEHSGPAYGKAKAVLEGIIGVEISKLIDSSE